MLLGRDSLHVNVIVLLRKHSEKWLQLTAFFVGFKFWAIRGLSVSGWVEFLLTPTEARRGASLTECYPVQSSRTSGSGNLLLCELSARASCA